MRQGRRWEEWSQAAAIIANVVNAHAGKVVCQPKDFHPDADRLPPPPATDDITVLDDFFFGE